MLRSLCLRQCVMANQVIRCHSTQLLKNHFSLTLLKPKASNFERFRCFGSTQTLLATKIDEPEAGKKIQVYKGLLSKQIKLIKIFSLATSATGVLLQPMLMKQAGIIGGLAAQVTALGVVGFFTFVTPLLLHFVCKKYVITMDYDPAKNEYSALTYTFFMRKKFTKFTPEDVHQPEVPGMFTSIMIKDTALFLDPTCFEDVDHYVKIMGYDKPIDFKLNLQEKDGEKSKKSSS